jgi:UDP-glucose 4-epimerase
MAPTDSPIIVTGGAGFIGSHIADAFLERGRSVIVVDDLSTGRIENLPAGARLEQIDIVDGKALTALIERSRPAVICHLAAQSSVTVSVKMPARDLEVNVRGTYNVCDAARKVGAPVVFASTGGALYGDSAPIPTPEHHPPAPLAPYGASKQAGEAYVATWGRFHDMTNVVLRLGNVYGPRQNPHGEAGVVAIFSDRLRAGAAPVLYGEGKPTRDYVHVHDVARAFIAAALGGRAGTYNVGWGVETSVLELLDMLRRRAHSHVEPEFAPLRPGELERSALDSTKIRDELGWIPEIPLERGISETFETYAPPRP